MLIVRENWWLKMLVILRENKKGEKEGQAREKERRTKNEKRKRRTKNERRKEN